MWEELVSGQAGILTRQQALAAGLSDAGIDAQVEARRWQRVYPGVLATFSGSLNRAARVWAALLSSGSGAVVSPQTAAELAGLISETGPLVHITIPAGRRLRARRGIVLHRSRNVAAARHPVLEPPRTRVEETVVDLTQTSPDLDAAMGWLIRAVASRRTTPAKLLAALAARRRVRWRAELIDALSDVAEGCHSQLELRYARQVERAHGLPRGKRQHRRGGRFDDVTYLDFATSVELDGKANHMAELAFRDHRRDNAVVLAGARVLRYGYRDVTRRPCAVAGEVAAVLRASGWAGRLKACGSGCAIPRQRG